MKDTILFGDCRETLKEFDEQARTCITSPPYYGLRDYGGDVIQVLACSSNSLSVSRQSPNKIVSLIVLKIHSKSNYYYSFCHRHQHPTQR